MSDILDGIFDRASEGEVHRVAIAGMLAWSELPAGPDLDRFTTAGRPIRLRFAARLPTPDGGGAAGTWHRLASPEGPAGLFHDSGTAVVVAPPPADIAAAARWAVPFAAALQGQLILHGTGFVSAGLGYAVIGESGAGKSTLASALGTLGADVLCDDLLPCDVVDGRVRIRARHGETAGVELAACLVLSGRDPAIAALQVSTPSRQDAFVELLRHGFSELALPNVLRMQMTAYEILVSRSVCLVGRMADRLDAVPEIAAELLRLLPAAVRPDRAGR